mgnify:CR=1 FL=1
MNQDLHSRSLLDTENKTGIYDKWADTYEDYVKSLGYNGPENVSKYFYNLYLNKFKNNEKLNILDFGCGTGLLGLNLSNIFNKNINIIGVDISNNMIEKANSKGIYKNIINLNLLELSNEEIKSKLGTFDYIISCGVFLEGHVPFSIIDKLKNIVKYNIIITVRESYILDKNKEFNKYIKDYIQEDIDYLNDVSCKLILI